MSLQSGISESLKTLKLFMALLIQPPGIPPVCIGREGHLSLATVFKPGNPNTVLELTSLMHRKNRRPGKSFNKLLIMRVKVIEL